MADLLLELFSEEVPARMQQPAAGQLQERMERSLEEARLTHGMVRTYVSPRHLAVVVPELPDQQPDRVVERKGPKVGAPEKALKGFLHATGLSQEQLEVRTVGKDEYYFACIEEKGVASNEAIKPLIEQVLRDFSWPKSQRWGGHDMQWVRPLHSILCMLDEQVLPVEFGHITGCDITYGHRFLASEQIVIDHAQRYLNKLEDAFVLVDHEQREGFIESKLQEVASKHGVVNVLDDSLLQEVTGLVEWPDIQFGAFDASLLDLPPEVLISEMKHHQKYFACRQSDGVLSNHFLFVSNMKSADAGAAIVAGNERVLRARLADGQFFWNQDRRTPLSEWAQATKGVIFHAKLGSVWGKTSRIASLAPLLAVFVPHANLTKVERAGLLCKADLVTGMVGEFPDLQGVMGRYYAQDQGEDAEVADAIRDHYQPAGASDQVPTAPVSITIALADKLDSLVGLFAVGDKPTGSKDPYALRRAALGVIRIILDNQLRMPLRLIFDKAASQYAADMFTHSADQTVQELLVFFAERLKVMLKSEGVRHDAIAAIFGDGQDDDLVRLVAKTKALTAFLATEDGENLLSAYRRASNILAAEEKKDGLAYDEAPSEGRFEQAEERTLYAALRALEAPIEEFAGKEDYAGLMSALATLREPVDAYFEAVTVNADDAILRQNRLYTLSLIRRSMNAIASFDSLEG